MDSITRINLDHPEMLVFYILVLTSLIFFLYRMILQNSERMSWAFGANDLETVKKLNRNSKMLKLLITILILLIAYINFLFWTKGF